MKFGRFAFKFGSGFKGCKDINETSGHLFRMNDPCLLSGPISEGSHRLSFGEFFLAGKLRWTVRRAEIYANSQTVFVDFIKPATLFYSTERSLGFAYFWAMLRGKVRLCLIFYRPDHHMTTTTYDLLCQLFLGRKMLLIWL